MNKATICDPAQDICKNWESPANPSKIVKACIWSTRPMHGRVIAAAYAAGAKVLNLTKVVDLILRQDGDLEGIVVNNTTAEMAGHDLIHVDPIALESKVVVDATGHDAVIVDLLHRRKVHTSVPGNGAMWVSRSEEEVVERTGEVYPQLFCGRPRSSCSLWHAQNGTGFWFHVTVRSIRSRTHQEKIETGIKTRSLCCTWLLRIHGSSRFIFQGQGSVEDKKEAWNFFQMAYEAQMKGNLEEATELYKRSLDYHPTAEAHTFLGWTYSFQGKLDEAIEECHLAIKGRIQNSAIRTTILVPT